MIRPAQEKDIEQITEIYNYAILNTTATFDTEPKTCEDRYRWFHEHTGYHYIIVYEENEKVLGYASLSQYIAKEAYDSTVELSIYVHHEYQRKHIGKQLMKSILDMAFKCDKIKTVVSLITAENKISIHMHEEAGFRYCGTINHVGEKFGRMLDVAFFQIK